MEEHLDVFYLLPHYFFFLSCIIACFAKSLSFFYFIFPSRVRRTKTPEKKERKQLNVFFMKSYRLSLLPQHS